MIGAALPAALVLVPRAEEAPADFVIDVDGTSLSASDAKVLIDRRMQAYEGLVPPNQIELLREQVVRQVNEDFIKRALLASKVQAADIEATPEEIDAAIQTTKNNLPPSLAFADFLKMQGLDDSGYRELIGLEVAARKLPDFTNVSEEDVAAFYEEKKESMNVPETVNARHILLSFDPTAGDEGKAEKRNEIDKIRQELLDGADFAESAKKYSTCPSSQKGGDLGQFSRGRMVPQFERAAFGQEIGEVGDVVETQFGYHIIEVTEKNEGKEQTLEDVRGQIEMFLNEKALGEYVQTLRAEATINYPDKAAETAVP
jgi:peptidyl-prolyl cis-trans isomerase C